MPGYSQKGGEQLGKMGIGQNIPKSNAGECHAAEIDEVEIGGRHACRTHPLKGMSIQAIDRHHQEYADLYEQKIPAGRGDNDVNVNVAWF